jgi:hypothetical protein
MVVNQNGLQVDKIQFMSLSGLAAPRLFAGFDGRGLRRSPEHRCNKEDFHA